MEKEEIKEVLKGQYSMTFYGRCKIQYKRIAEVIEQQGYCVTSTSSAYREQVRIDWVEDGEYYSTGVIRRTAGLYFAELKFGNSNLKRKIKKLGIDVDLVLENLETDGYTGVYICSQVRKGNKPNPEKIENMQIAQMRHVLTDYDDIDKRGMTDYEVRELRRRANEMAQ